MAIPGVDDYPIKLGTLLFTMVEPERGHEVEYNRWYEHDHFYAGCMIAPWQFAGDRFVATRRMKDLRYPANTDMTMGEDNLTGSYLAIYWVLEGHHDDWNDWSVIQVNNLHRDGRMFAHRQHIHTLLYELEWSARSAEVSTTIELALDRNYPGLVVVAGDVKEGHTHAEVEAWMKDQYLPGAFAASWGPDLVSSNIVLPMKEDRPADVVLPDAGPSRFLQLHFLDHDPEEGWAEGYAKIGEAIDASGLATHVWTSPFLNTVFGTDTYTGELW
jgi:hypothetical protein